MDGDPFKARFLLTSKQKQTRLYHCKNGDFCKGTQCQLSAKVVIIILSTLTLQRNGKFLQTLIHVLYLMLIYVRN